MFAEFIFKKKTVFFSRDDIVDSARVKRIKMAARTGLYSLVAPNRLVAAEHFPFVGEGELGLRAVRSPFTTRSSVPPESRSRDPGWGSYLGSYGKYLSPITKQNHKNEHRSC